jgi:hypothetical protein
MSDPGRSFAGSWAAPHKAAPHKAVRILDFPHSDEGVHFEIAIGARPAHLADPALLGGDDDGPDDQAVRPGDELIMYVRHADLRGKVSLSARRATAQNCFTAAALLALFEDLL